MNIKQEQKQTLINNLKQWIKTDDKSAVRISVSNYYGHAVLLGMDAKILLEWLEEK